MNGDEPAAAPLSLRERRWAVAVQEILAAAEDQIAENGPAALSLRAVARSLGMTVQALYHYFPSRDELITALVAKAYGDLADAVQKAVDTAPEDSDPPRMVIAAEGYRQWGVDHPERFQLIYGAPLRHYAAPAEGSSTRAVRRMSGIFQNELFRGFTREQLAAADYTALSPALERHLKEFLSPSALGGLPSPAVPILISAWGQMHGLVVLEVFGHTSFVGPHQAELFRMAMLAMLQDVRRRIPADVAAR
ncbi:TetR/AcrR family transcriptional regulator [Streptomyces coelicoflavus]|uniref:TetR/AcrR family transcriptional regulator n=1 Tax=Streptomyces coelicoflavus TaxID=285562 RepID=A0A7K3PKE1_9ACTN|nr:TetR/AcrR family transcriptional regulator [Streptomyces coelicoflavus]NEB10317.1 TetR/AcrR family transcriptional regulator [Streptomyces coelicoflavus]